MATRLLAHYLAKAYKEQASAGVVTAADLDGVSHYLGHRREQVLQMTASFPQLWKQIDSARFRRRLAVALGFLLAKTNDPRRRPWVVSIGVQSPRSCQDLGTGAVGLTCGSCGSRRRAGARRWCAPGECAAYAPCRGDGGGA